MTNLKHKLTQDMFGAMKEKNLVAKAVLSILKANVENEEIKLKRTLTHDEGVTILNRERKQIKDSLDGFSKAGRTDLVGKEQAKLLIVESYLPKQLTEPELYAILEERISGEDKPFGQWMKELSAEYKGQVEGKTLSEAIRKTLQK